MPKVLHLGPFESRGGMRTVMRTLVEFPPDGWQASALSTHQEGSMITKLGKLKSSFSSFKAMCCSDQPPDVIHIHTASDWSWIRKKKFLNFARRNSLPCVVHLHSGNMYSWLVNNKTNQSKSKRMQEFVAIADDPGVRVVVLSEHWKEKFESFTSSIIPISNPVHPRFSPRPDIEREEGKLLLLGRDVPAKNHDFAIKIAREIGSSVSLWMTGVNGRQDGNIHPLGWVSDEELLTHLHTAEIVLIPSDFEGQPMVALEALACGTKVLASPHVFPISGMQRVRTNTIEDWKNTIIEMLQHKDHVEMDASSQIENIQQQWRNVYESLLQ
jgi:glycosyltransferase involved in cell wall biosynthesis